jgi:hypothetical protein
MSVSFKVAVVMTTSVLRLALMAFRGRERDRRFSRAQTTYRTARHRHALMVPQQHRHYQQLRPGRPRDCTGCAPLAVALPLKIPRAANFFTADDSE